MKYGIWVTFCGSLVWIAWKYNLSFTLSFQERNGEILRGYTRNKEPKKTISWVDVRQLTVNILGWDYKTRSERFLLWAHFQTMCFMFLHLQPFFLFPPNLHFYSPLSSSLHPLISPTLWDCGKLMGLSPSLRMPAFLLNWRLVWCMRGTQMFAIPAVQQRWCRAWLHVTGSSGTVEIIRDWGIMKDAHNC